MGGIGSGNRCQFGRDTTEGMKSVDIHTLQRGGWLKRDYAKLTWRRNGQETGYIELYPSEDSVRFSYRSRARGEEIWQGHDYNVTVEYTPCHYGGVRAWFRCPCCHKRVVILYGGALFLCRHCHNLTYESQKESDIDRLVRRADKIRERLDWEGGILNGGGLKPKGMHWKTFNRLDAEYHQIETIIFGQLGCL